MTKILTENSEREQVLAALSLGKEVEYKSTYAPELLQSVPRNLSRQQIGLSDELPFKGEDIWNGYELSWLNSKGKPQVAILQCRVPYNSPNLIESKSFKLYLNSFNQQKLDSVEALNTCLQNDLSHCAGENVKITLIMPEQFSNLSMAELKGDCIDDLDIEIDHYELNTGYLKTTNNRVEESLTSNLLKSNCLITDQPDWASILIKYEGAEIDKAGLLKYLISFRMHNEFHEQCVERIFCDIQYFCKPEKLSVFARYTRRGGLDINPFRSNFESEIEDARNARQ